VAVDPFAGSANTLFWLARQLRARRAIGFERDSGVYAATRRNLSIVEFAAERHRADHQTGLGALTVPVDEQLVVVVASPWGAAPDPARGFDLRRTTPPVTEILDFLAGAFPAMRFSWPSRSTRP
jgi:hypothetical protein